MANVTLTLTPDQLDAVLRALGEQLDALEERRGEATYDHVIAHLDRLIEAARGAYWGAIAAEHRLITAKEES